MELPLSDHMGVLDPSQCCIGRMEGLEAKHGARDPLYETVILFHDGVVAWTLTPLVSVVACLLEGAINAAQIQR